MEKENTAGVVEAATALADRCGIALVGSVEPGGFPNIKAMLKMENEGLRTVWFSTNASSRRAARFRENPRACVYFMEPETFIGLMLTGTMEVLRDAESRHRLWHAGFDRYYPLGVDDPDYTVLRFTARRGNLYRGLSNVDFDIEE